jgi:hypothetical protein
MDTEVTGKILCPCRGSKPGLLYGKTGENKIKDFEIITMDIQKKIGESYIANQTHSVVSSFDNFIIRGNEIAT